MDFIHNLDNYGRNYGVQIFNVIVVTLLLLALMHWKHEQYSLCISNNLGVGVGVLLG